MSEPPSPPETHCSVIILRLTQPQVSGDVQSEAVRDELLAHLDQTRPDHVVLDLSGVKYLSSAGIAPLLALAKAVREREGRFILAGLTPHVEGVLTASRLITSGRSLPATFEHQADVSAAIAALYGPHA